jgi:hypothetical protein
MLKRISGRVVIAATFGLIASTALADEIVHFTNGAEMAVRSHTIDKEKDMVKLDLGGNSYISFPMTMVDKIVSAGQNVFSNPAFHPANQAHAGIPGVHGVSGSVGYKPQPDGKGNAGVMLGEVADAIPAENPVGPDLDNTVMGSRKVFNPAFPPKPGAGGVPQVIMPVSPQVKPPVQFRSKSPAPPPTPTPAPEAQDSGDQPSEDLPDR